MNIRMQDIINRLRGGGATGPLLALLPLRSYLGIFYVQTGWNKIARGDGGLAYQESLVDFVTQSLDRAPAWYAAFLEHVVLNAPGLFTLLVSWGELLLGLSLLFGLFVRPAGLLGTFMALNFTLAGGRAVWLPSFDVLLTILLFSLALVGAGRVWGGDALFASFRQSEGDNQ